MQDNYLFKPDFQYQCDNPYHDRLADFDQFVLRDRDGEENQNAWNQKVFLRDTPLVVEIGSGFGEFMLEYTELFPHHNFVGIDHRFKRSFQVAKKLEKRNHPYFRFLRARGERMGYLFGKHEIDQIFYFFPDPWPKKRHHKKRLFQKNFLDQIHSLLKPTGKILIKTDHDAYFQWMLDEISKVQDSWSIELESRDLWQEFPQHYLASFQTKFEKIFRGQGTKIKALVLSPIQGA